VISAFKAIPRENFVPESHKDEAYADHPLPIGYDQTISQPTTVMIMTDALELNKGDKVLEIGTGSGYQAAIISVIIGAKGKVITTEIVPELAAFARANLKKTKITNVKVICTDGSQGYSKEAPYDRIIVTAACPKIPQVLIDQLKQNGIIVAPVGSLFFGQSMIKGIKRNNQLETRNLGSFVFVPLKGKYGH
jgi:protein-L-isoaspartate(D-aspartate) O-methyltransferase